MASLAEDAAAEHTRALGGSGLATPASLNSEEGAFVVNESSVPQRAPRRASKHRYIQALTIAIVASFAAVYMVLTCFRHISHLNNVGPQLRSVAEGGADKTACLGGPEEEPSTSAEGGSGGDEPHAPLGAEGGAAEGEREEAAAAAGPHAGGWARRRMSREWTDRLLRLFLRLRNLADECAAILPFLEPSHAIDLAQQVAQWGAVEVAAFAMAPEEVQPARADAGSAFVMLVEKVLSEERFAAELQQRRCRGQLEALQRLTLRLTDIPPPQEKLSRSTYRGVVTSQWTLASYASSHLKTLLEMVQPENNPDGIPPDLAERSVHIMQAIFQQRRRALLQRGTVGFWFMECQAVVARYLLYTPKDFHEARAEGMLRLSDMLELMAIAVREAGGLPHPIPLPVERAEELLELESTRPRELPPPPQPATQPSPVVPARGPPPLQTQARFPPQPRPRLPFQPRARIAPGVRPRLPPEVQPRFFPRVEALPRPELHAPPEAGAPPPPPQAAPFPPFQPEPFRGPPPQGFPVLLVHPVALPHPHARFPPLAPPSFPLQPRPRFPPQGRPRLPPEAQPRPPPRAQAPPPPPRAEPRLPPQEEGVSPPQVQAPPPPQAEPHPPVVERLPPPPRAERPSAPRVSPRMPDQLAPPFGPPQVRGRPRLPQPRGRSPRDSRGFSVSSVRGPPPPQGQPAPPPHVESPPGPEPPLLLPRQFRPPHRRALRPRGLPQGVRPPRRPFAPPPIQMPTPPVPQVPPTGPVFPPPLPEGVPAVLPPPPQPPVYVEGSPPFFPVQQMPPPPQPPLFVELPQPMDPQQLPPPQPFLVPDPGVVPIQQPPPMAWAPVVGPPPFPAEAYLVAPGDQLYYHPQDPYAVVPQGFYLQQVDPSLFPPPLGPQLMPPLEQFPVALPPQAFYPVQSQGPEPPQEQPPPPPPQPAAADAGAGEGQGEGGNESELEAQLSSLSVGDPPESQ